MMSSRVCKRPISALTSAEKSRNGAATAGLEVLAAGRARIFGALFTAFFATGLDSFLGLCLTTLAALRCAFFMRQNSSSHAVMSSGAAPKREQPQLGP